MAQQPSRFIIVPQEEESFEIVVIDPNHEPMNISSFINRTGSLDLAPITGNNIRAVGLGSSRVIYLGVNVELPGLPLNQSIHAVQFLVANVMLNSSDEQHLRYLAVSGQDSVFDSPCGHCCQFLQELDEAANLQVLIKNPRNKEDRYVFLDAIFTRPESLLHEDCYYKYSFLLSHRDNGLSLLDDQESNGYNDLKDMALEAANRSYAPYSKCHSGVAFRDCDGKVYRGWYVESVACNPSLGPVQAAIVDYVARSGIEGILGFDKIVEAVLVEKKGAVVNQEDTARLIFKKIAYRECVFTVYHC